MHRRQVDRTPRLSVWALAVTALAIGGVGAALALAPAAQGAQPAGPPEIASLDCDQRSLTEDGEVAYSITDPPDYPEGYRSTESPESLATGFARDQRLDAAVSARTAISGSGDRVDVALAAPDGRVVGLVSTVHINGWRLNGGIACAAG